MGLSEHSVEELKGADKLSEEFISEFEPYQVQMYSLGERAEDLKSFIDYYLGSANKKYSRSVEFTPRAMGCEEREGDYGFFRCHVMGCTKHLAGGNEPISNAGYFTDVFQD